MLKPRYRDYAWPIVIDNRRRCRELGASLLEVLVATALLGTLVLAALASQAGLIRAQRDAAQRLRAVLLSDAVAETLRNHRAGGFDTALARTEAQWRPIISSALSDGSVSIAAKSSSMALIVLTWTASPGSGPARQIGPLAGRRDLGCENIDAEAAVATGAACMSVAVALP